MTSLVAIIPSAEVAGFALIVALVWQGSSLLAEVAVRLGLWLDEEASRDL